MVTLVNRAKMSTSTTGTGTITLGSAEDGYQSFADAGVTNGDVVRYVIEDGDDWEIGSGTYTATGTTLSRTVDESSNSDAALSLTGSAVVFITAAAEDVFQGELIAENPSSPTAPSATGSNAVAIGDGATSSQTRSIAIGYNSTSSGIASTALGPSANASGFYATALGYNAKAVSGGFTSVLALGNSYASGSDSFAAAIGNNTSTYGATGANSVAIGAGLARATSSRAMAFGNNAIASGADSVAIGRSTDATASASFGFGYAVLASHANSLVFGTSASSSAINQITLGSTSDTVRISSAYTLPTSDGTNGQVLTTDGSGAVTFSDAIEFYDENFGVSETRPVASGSNSIAIGNLAVASNTGSYAIGYNATASSVLGFAVGANSSSGGSRAVTGTAAMALGGSYASGTDSFAAAIGNNTSSYGATGANSVAIGRQAKATQLHSYAFGSSASATNTGSVVLGGSTCTSSGLYSTTIGGAFNGATGDYSIASGRYGNTNSIYGKRSHASQSNLRLGEFSLGISTTDATASALTTNGSAASTNNQIILQDNSAYSFSGTIIARESAAAGSDYASWEIKGALLRDANAASTVLGNGIKNKLYASAGASAWDIALTADTTNGGLKIEVTGAASTNIRWVATVNTSEVTYA